MYFVLVEIDTFEVAGLRCHSAARVRELIEKALSDRGRIPVAGEFDKLMWSMRGNLEVEWRWEHKVRGVVISVRRFA